ncbi:MAG: Bifunctional oligoribonuclease and PAP phosphatase NrnA [Tenericutes bacterium ADurb.Bin087]|nr:MAG: Bifunctional oligoribonuclease and PAP phosphatase NrnA [Tenericutes bacterium ADurb.Bin087]
MRCYSQEILDKIKEYKKPTKKIFALVEKYEKVAIFAHFSPDFDAFGSQFGLGVYLKNHYPNKNIKIIGQSLTLLNGELYPYMDEVSDSWFEDPFVAIIVDTATLERVSDNRYTKAKALIKIDHHPNVEPYGDICFVDVTSVAVTEMIAVMLLADGRTISRDIATYLFSGIVGDSGRFKYASTTSLTFGIAEVLTSLGVDLSYVYTRLYVQDLDDLRCIGYILNNFKITKNGFAYYVIDDKTLKKLNITADRAKENVNIFSDIRGIKIWASITERVDTNEWRVSIRSAEKPINEFAQKWRGGGHVQASGASLVNREEIDIFVQEMDDYIGS